MSQSSIERLRKLSYQNATFYYHESQKGCSYYGIQGYDQKKLCTQKMDAWLEIHSILMDNKTLSPEQEEHVQNLVKKTKSTSLAEQIPSA